MDSVAKLSYIDRIKLLMMVAMTTGHIAWVIVPTETLLSHLLHFFARLTIPLACFLLVIGYQKTHDLTAYVKRLFGFALVSQLPFVLYLLPVSELIAKPSYLFYSGNVLFTLGFALLALICADKITKAVPIAQLGYGLAIIVLCYVSLWSDWSYAPILWVLAIFYYRVLGFLLVCFGLFLLSLGAAPEHYHYLAPLVAYEPMDYGVLMSALVMGWYNKNQAKSPKDFRLPRSMFYWYYPLHLWVLWAILM